MVSEISRDMARSARIVKKRGLSKSAFKRLVKGSILKMTGKSRDSEYVLSKIKEAQQAIDRIWDGL